MPAAMPFKELEPNNMTREANAHVEFSELYIVFQHAGNMRKNMISYVYIYTYIYIILYAY